ncbi:MAG: flagellar biosynthesis anti-sigma factor FlgM [Termitinemataceae bacterium]|nr:MAG: flagellar biosynthesis anti-sigma factor FlgM [Termitinemataceae bacterium]
MTIDRVGSTNPIQPNKPGGKVVQPAKAEKSDSVSISAEAVKKADWFKAMEVAKAAPDVRAERIAELKAKINDPSYITETILYGTVDKVIDVLFRDSDVSLKVYKRSAPDSETPKETKEENK